MVHSERALSPHWTRRFHDALPGERRLEWLVSQWQTDFYDDPALVELATDLMADWLSLHLR